VQEYIFILFSEMEDLAHYIVMDETGKQIIASDQEDSLENLSYLRLNRQVIILIPGKYVSFYKVTLPYGAREKLQASLPYVLENEVSEDIDNLTFILGPKLSTAEQKAEEMEINLEREAEELLLDAEQIASAEEDSIEQDKDSKSRANLNKTSKKASEYLVATLSTEVMDYYFKLLKKNHIKPDYLLSDNYCLRGHYNNQIYINGVERQVYFLSRDDDIYTIDLENFTFFKDSLLKNNNFKNEVYSYKFEENVDIPNVSEIKLIDSEPELFATRWLTQAVKINFLTGKYKVFKIQLKNKLLWKVVLSLIIFVLLSDFGISISKYILVSNQVAKIDEQIVKEWRKVFPHKTGIQLPSSLSAAGNLMSREIVNVEKHTVQNNFFSTLNILGIILKKYTNVELEGISFLESELKIKIKAPNIIVLNNFEKAFQIKGKTIKKISLKEEQDTFIAGFMITVG